jgi:hypothetical protein
MEIKISELESRLLSTDTKLLEEKAVTEMLKQELHRVLKEHEVVRWQGRHACMHECVCVRARKRFCAWVGVQACNPLTLLSIASSLSLDLSAQVKSDIQHQLASVRRDLHGVQQRVCVSV